MPKTIATCFNKQPAKGKDANEAVLNLKQHAAEQSNCGKASVAWYKHVKAANEKAAAPAAAPASPAK